MCSVDTLSEKEGFLTFGIKPYIKKTFTNLQYVLNIFF